MSYQKIAELFMLKSYLFFHTQLAHACQNIKRRKQQVEAFKELTIIPALNE